MTDVTSAAYPRVLVVNHEPFNNKSATGLTMQNLFHGWPHDRIAQLYLEAIDVDTAYCTKNYLMDHTEVWTEWPRVHYNAARQRQRERMHITLGRQAVMGKQQPLQTFLLQAKMRVSLDIVNVVNLFPYHIPPAVLDWIDAYQPDVLYTMLGSTQLTKIVLLLNERFRLPLVTHFMDDWPGTLHADSLIAPIMRPVTAAWLKRILVQTNHRLAISDAMATEFTRRYGSTWDVFMNCVDPALYSSVSPTPRAIPRFVFVGGLHLNRWCVLQEIGKAAKTLAAEGIPLEILIYAHPSLLAIYHKELEIPPVMRVGGSLANHEVPAVLTDADVLIHVESFDASIRKYTRYSVSTKIPEYMVTGRPIFGYGPGEVASLRYITATESGLVVGDRNPALLVDALRRLATDPALRAELGAHGRQTALSRHEAAGQREAFRQTLARAASSAGAVAVSARY